VPACEFRVVVVDAVLVRWPHGSGDGVVSGKKKGLFGWFGKPKKTTGAPSKPPRKPINTKPIGKPPTNGR